jgi:hypothetical protein
VAGAAAGRGARGGGRGTWDHCTTPREDRKTVVCEEVAPAQGRAPGRPRSARAHAPGYGAMTRVNNIPGGAGATVGDRWGFEKGGSRAGSERVALKN